MYTCHEQFYEVTSELAQCFCSLSASFSSLVIHKKLNINFNKENAIEHFNRLAVMEKGYSLPTFERMDNNKAILLSFAISFAIFSSSPIEGLICNGMAEFCDLRINQATFTGTHNSGAGFDGILYYHTKIGLSIPAWSCWYRSQGQSITKQLDNGIRYFDIDTCFVDSGIWEHGPWTCHSGAYGGPIRKMLQQINEWMLQNPTEVVIIKFGRDTVSSKAQKIGSEILEQVIIGYILLYIHNVGGVSH